MYKPLLALVILITSAFSYAGTSLETIGNLAVKGGGGRRGISAERDLANRNEKTVGDILTLPDPVHGGGTGDGGGGSQEESTVTRATGKCSVPTDNIPESLKALLFGECKMSEGVTHKSYCDCIEDKMKKFSPTSTQDKADFEAKKKKSFDRLEELVVKKNADLWIKAYKKILDAQSQMAAIMGTDGFPSPLECSAAGLVGSVKDKISQASGACSSSTLGKYLAAFGSSTAAGGSGPDYSSLEAVLSLPNPSIPTNASKSSATAECLSPGFKGLLSMSSAIRVPSDIEPGGIKKAILNSALDVSLMVSRRDVLKGMIQSLDSIITTLKNTSQLKAGEFESASIMKRHRRLDDFYAAKAIDAFPVFSYMVTNLSSPYVIGVNGDVRDANPKELKDRRDQMLTQMIKLRDMYVELLGIKENKAIDAKQKAKDAFTISSKFMAGLKETIDIGDKNEAIAAAKVECLKLSEDFIRLACAPAINISDAQIVEAVLPTGDKLLPSPGRCSRTEISDKDALSCLLVQNAECASAKQVNFTNYSTYDNLEVVPDLRTFTSIENRLERAEERYGSEISDFVCKDYSLWLKTQCKGKQDNELLKCKALAANSPQAYAKLNPDSEVGQLFDASTTAANDAGIDQSALTGQQFASHKIDGGEEILKGINSSIANDEKPSTTFGAQFLKAATDGVGKNAVNAENNNGVSQSYITPTQTIPQQIAKKDEAINTKESEILTKVEDINSIQDPVLKSAAAEELKALRAELEALKKEREALASAQQEVDSEVVENAGANKNGNQSNNRSPANVTGSTAGSSSSVVSGGSSITGGSAGGGSTSGSTSGFGSTGSSSGGSATAPTTVQGVLSSIGSGSSALLEANQLKLTVGGQEVAAQDVTTLQIPSGSSAQKVIQDNQSKLKFINGVALVELIGLDKKPVYYQVKKQGEGFELIAVEDDIPLQVRAWSASYANFLKKIQTIRGPSGLSTEGRP